MAVDTFWLCQTSRRNRTGVLCSSCGLDNCVAIVFLVMMDQGRGTRGDIVILFIRANYMYIGLHPRWDGS